jgi:thiamine biosynthesis protein ThiC
MVSMLASSTVDRGFEPRSGQTKDYKLGICQVNLQWDDDVRFVLDQHTELDFDSASSLKQQSAGRHVAPLEHIILIPSQPALLDGVIVSLLASSVVDRGFVLRSGQTKDY